jgi:NAD(P)-dependent dehydrogenase (short-subunit alcohol dehydrogenase family)
MASILITGSADGLGQMAAKLLIADGHDVVLHARSPQREREALAALPGARGAVHGDLSSIVQMRSVAEQANALGRFDAVVHNAGVYLGPRSTTVDGLERVFAVNVLAPYVLTAAIARPGRLVYLSSGMHRTGEVRLDDLQWLQRPWDDTQAYCDSKLLVVMLARAVGRRWPDVRANAVDPGWIATKMGGAGAPDGLDVGSQTQAWLAGSSAPEAASATDGYWFRGAHEEPRPETGDVALQEELLAECARLSGVALDG